MYTGDRFVGHLLCAFCHTKDIYFRVDLIKARDLIAQRPCLQVFFFSNGSGFYVKFLLAYSVYIGVNFRCRIKSRRL